MEEALLAALQADAAAALFAGLATLVVGILIIVAFVMTWWRNAGLRDEVDHLRDQVERVSPPPLHGSPYRAPAPRDDDDDPVVPPPPPRAEPLTPEAAWQPPDEEEQAEEDSAIVAP